jgi:AbrB family looped-hinge helix DNA binding protein
MITAKTTEKGHVIIPAALRRKYNIKKGTRVAVSEGEGNVILIRRSLTIPSRPQEACSRERSLCPKPCSETGARTRNVGSVCVLDSYAMIVPKPLDCCAFSC